ncbi:hypothetical protein GGX14DRAFT_678737 [Mycena pura]|uniref:Uncharacterized protein n=1 Tax=Mycena pura TaxID=153505 RepID=A0AAD6Y7B8_9AGAR|nr:hypothetical protein GGX14DRAFT_678737 [Mycena pura]
MPPTLRSSVPTSPPTTPGPSASSKASASTPKTAASTMHTPRKSPHCKTCGRPRKGHPSRTCADDAVAAATSDATSTPKQARASDAPATGPPKKMNATAHALRSPAPTPHADPDAAAHVTPPTPAHAHGLVDALDTLALDARDRHEKRARRKSALHATRAPSPLRALPSVSTATGALLESLKAPGLLHGGPGAADVDSCGSNAIEKRDVVIRWRDASGTPTRMRTGQRMDPRVLVYSVLM